MNLINAARFKTASAGELIVIFLSSRSFLATIISEDMGAAGSGYAALSQNTS
jgi:hypothetical protein